VFLAGAQLEPRFAPELIRRLRAAGYVMTADKLERTLGVRTLQVTLTETDRVALLRVTEGCPPEYAALRAALRQEHEWRRAEGL
jgi:hypothetical protein